MKSTLTNITNAGLGLGLRSVHFDHILRHWPSVDWFEAISENFMDSGGRPRHILRQVAERYPVALHGVSMSIGSTDPLDFNYLSKLKKMAQEINPVLISDHLCWTGVMNIHTHDLLPLPLTEDVLKHVVSRVLQVQDFLERPLILENPSSYISYSKADFSEPDFLRYLTEATSCRLLLDVNNVYVSCFNSGENPVDYLQKFPCDKVVQMHLAGHTHCGTHIIDTHDQPVLPEVWELYRLAYQLTGGVSSLLEWDGHIPAFDVCHQEILTAKKYMSGDFSPGKFYAGSPANSDALSTPASFLVPDVMTLTTEG